MGKAYIVPTSLDRLRKQQREIKDLQGLIRNRRTPRPVASTAFAGVSAAGSEGGTGNFLRTAGDTMIGPFALAPPVDFSIEIDADGIIDIGESSSNSQYTSNIQLEDIQPNTFTLDTIAGAAFDGQILVLRTFAPNSPITIAQATQANGGNIQTPNDTNFDMGDLQMISLIFDASLIVFDNAPGGTWRVLTGDATGGGGLSEPVIFGINTLTPQTLPTTTTIAWNTKNPQQITLDRAVEFDFTNLPANGSYEGILVIIDIDAIGGFDSPIWPASLVNPPIIPTTALSRFSVMLYTIDNGTIVTHATSVGSSSSGSGFSGNLSDLVINVTKDWLAQGVSNFGSLTGITGITGTGASVIISGIDTYDFFQSGQSIQNKADPDGGLLYNVDDLQSHIFRANTDEIARFEEAASAVFRLNMLDHSIRDSLDITFSNSSGITVFAGSSPAIGFDSVASRLKINYPTGASIFITENNTIGATQIKTNSLETNIVNALDLLQLGVDITVPTIPGEFRNDGTDVTTFSGGAVRNFSNISTTVSATTELDNLTTTSINADLIPQAGKLLGTDADPWSDTTSNKFSLGTAGTFAASDNAIIADAVTGMEFNTPTTDSFSFFFGSGTVSVILEVSKLQMVSGSFQGRALDLDDTATFPAATGELRRNGSVIAWETNEFSIRRTTSVAAEQTIFNIVKVDANPGAFDSLGELKFQVDDSGVITTYASINTVILDATDNAALQFNVRAANGLLAGMTLQGDDSNQRFELIMGGTTGARIQPFLGVMGYFVTPQVIDFSLNIGTSGSLECPRINDGSPNLSALNTAGGAFNTSLFVHDIADGTLYVKNSNTQWDAYARTGTVI